MKNPIINGVRILKKGVRDLATGTYTPCWYNTGSRLRRDGSVYNAVTIYARDYRPLPAGLQPINDSDSRTDYFEQDRAVFAEGTEGYTILRNFLPAYTTHFTVSPVR
jgi:hypothetical protein